jgi:hypothetical protein
MPNLDLTSRRHSMKLLHPVEKVQYGISLPSNSVQKETFPNETQRLMCNVNLLQLCNVRVHHLVETISTIV